MSERFTCSCVFASPETVLIAMLVIVLVLHPGGSTLCEMKLCVAPVSNNARSGCHDVTSPIVVATRVDNRTSFHLFLLSKVFTSCKI
jgi:hypothetical protein